MDILKNAVFIRLQSNKIKLFADFCVTDRLSDTEASDRRNFNLLLIYAAHFKEFSLVYYRDGKLLRLRKL